MHLDDRMMLLVADALAGKIFQDQREKIADLPCISIARFAGMLDISTSQASRVIEEFYDFGPRDHRLSFNQMSAILEKRKVKKEKKRRRANR